MNTYLEPGIYIRRVGQKSLELLKSEIFDLNEGVPSSLEELAAQVAWVWIALERRKEMLASIPWSWRRDDKEVDDPGFEIDLSDLLPRIDESIQLYSTAYIFKLRNGFGQLLGVKWLDPTTIRPDYEHIDEHGPLTYIRQARDGSRVVPREDIIDFTVQGMREFGPSIPAAAATKYAAQILYGMDVTAGIAFENNGLPAVLVRVPNQTSLVDVHAIGNFFRRLFNQKTKAGQVRVAAFRADDMDLETINLDMGKLMMLELEESKIQAILSAHHVPKSIALNDDMANVTNSEEGTRKFVTSMGTRAKKIAYVFNNTAEFKEMGLEIVFDPDAHYSMKRDEAQMAASFQRLTSGGLNPEPALWLLGVHRDDFPVEMQDNLFKSTASGPGPMATDEEPSDADIEEEVEADVPEVKASDPFQYELSQWHRKVMRALKAGKSADVHFIADIIPQTLAAAIRGQLAKVEQPAEVAPIFRNARLWADYYG